ncbi:MULTISPECIES: recombinase family protein [Bacillus cereus group]|uniref:recombinase family protein n=1 Tax=Bacillus cereus group TaxID=86661 RepID=UPI0008FDC0E1|nr:MULTISPECIES: recombinase family protein [Bacillus cereus group]OJD90646.1 resolvase [Bacillus anthracis]OPA38144.1 resolvase [Bacillus cereus]
MAIVGYARVSTKDQYLDEQIERLIEDGCDKVYSEKYSGANSNRGIAVVFLKEQIDFSTPAGKLMFTMLGAIAEFERDLINERTAEGRERAKAIGKHMGRKGQDEKQVKQAMNLFFNRKENGLSVNDISKMTGVPPSTIYAKAKELKEGEL